MMTRRLIFKGRMEYKFPILKNIIQTIRCHYGKHIYIKHDILDHDIIIGELMYCRHCKHREDTLKEE